MSTASTSKKRCAEAHEVAPKNKAKLAKKTDKAQEELEVEVKSTNEAAKILSAKRNLQKKVKLTVVRGGKIYKAPPNIKDFSNVKSIDLKHFDLNWKSFFEEHSFSEIEELRIDCSLQTKDINQDISYWKYIEQCNMESIFSGMDNLKHLYVRSELPRFYDEITSSFSLESADVYTIFPFVENSKDTMKDLKLCLLAGEGGSELSFGELEDFFKNYTKLEKLAAVFCIDESDLENALPKKKSLKHLDIHVYADNINRTNLAGLEFILASTPSLETLTTYMEISAPFVHFLARTMPKLKKLIGRGGFAEDAMSTLKELKEKEDKDSINADFAICFETNRPWKKEFKGFYCH